MLGPTGGYLVGFIAAAWVVGRLAQLGWDRRVAGTVAAMVAGNFLIYACGLLWFGRRHRLGQAGAQGRHAVVPARRCAENCPRRRAAAGGLAVAALTFTLIHANTG